VVREGSFELDTSADRALLFFTPEGERAWVKGWDPKPMYPPQGGVVFEANAVFRLDQDGERSLWTLRFGKVRDETTCWLSYRRHWDGAQRSVG